METITADVVVVGLGAFGSAALWRLAERGVDVVGIDRFDVGHDLGSSHGLTRLFRVACKEHPGLAPIARRSLELWTALGERYGETYVEQGGCLNVGAPGSSAVAGTVAAAEGAGVPLTHLDHDRFVAAYPQYAASDPTAVAALDPEGGICFPERNVRAHGRAAAEAGARIYPGTRVTEVELVDGGVRVVTPTVTFEAAQAVVAAGAWNGKLLPDLPLTPRRTPLYWFAPKADATESFDIADFPSFVYELPDGSGLWGHGSGDGFHIKIGLWEGAGMFHDTDPDELDRYIHPHRDIDMLAEAVAAAFPQIDPVPVKVIPCMITNSPDEQFLVGRPGGDPRLVVAGGDSGHGFKHAAGIGELLAQITVGETPYTAVDFMDPDRFRA
ncbi:N-methyl-L-tryptophan oxidase [Puerhibacterium puerhi]|uniref:N-methyl-L-tryptophan oxidase n=1 Tax=Puerhibacterium puerhi TaxID=2692623 RepID=UPI00135B4923|nr:N-methyl-L-tryptophan oxidase [Puerhibacterium puerhi]